MRHHIFGSVVDLLFQIGYIHVEIGRLVMLFGIAGHAVTECFAGYDVHFGSVDEIATVEFIYLKLQLRCVGISVFIGNEAAFMLGLVATENQYIGYAEKIKVNQGIFGFDFGKSAAYNVGYGRYVVFLLYGRGHSHSPGTASLADFLVESVGRIFIYHLAAVGGYVYKQRVELLENVDVAKQLCYAFAFQGRKHFKGESRLTM